MSTLVLHPEVDNLLNETEAQLLELTQGHNRPTLTPAECREALHLLGWPEELPARLREHVLEEALMRTAGQAQTAYQQGWEAAVAEMRRINALLGHDQDGAEATKIPEESS